MQPPSPSEMAVLKTLWSEGALSAREVHARLGGPQDWSYSTTRTLITRMVEKGLVSKHDSHGLAVFAPALSKAAVLSGMVRRFSAQVFDLDAPLPASAFAGSPLLDDDDLAELETLLEQEGGEDEN